MIDIHLITVSTLAIYILVGIFFFIIPPILYIFLSKHKKALYIIFSILFILYIIILLVGVFGSIQKNDDTTTISLIFDNSLWAKGNFAIASSSAFNILVNLVLLFPLGEYIAIICKKPILKTILISFACAFMIEFLQFLLPVSRTTELLDLILNTISGILGTLYILLIKYLSKLIQNKK